MADIVKLLNCARTPIIYTTCLVTNNIPHNIYSGGNLMVACRKKKKKLTDLYLKIIIEFQTIFKLNCN